MSHKSTARLGSAEASAEEVISLSAFFTVIHTGIMRLLEYFFFPNENETEYLGP